MTHSVPEHSSCEQDSIGISHKSKAKICTGEKSLESSSEHKENEKEQKAQYYDNIIQSIQEKTLNILNIGGGTDMAFWKMRSLLQEQREAFQKKGESLSSEEFYLMYKVQSNILQELLGEQGGIEKYQECIDRGSEDPYDYYYLAALLCLNDQHDQAAKVVIAGLELYKRKPKDVILEKTFYFIQSICTGVQQEKNKEIFSQDSVLMDRGKIH